MEYKSIYESWLENPYFDEATKKELESIKNDENEIKERFYKDLEFGTAGLRGIIGAGTNRMNVYTVRKATQGLANYINKKGFGNQGVAIAFDSRRMSPEFADEAALCLAANGIKAYVFESLRPTPELSFAVRQLKCIAGYRWEGFHNIHWKKEFAILECIRILQGLCANVGYNIVLLAKKCLKIDLQR